MSYQVQGVGFVATTSGQTTITAQNLDDAEAIGIYMPSTISTGISYTVSVAPTSTGTVFYPLTVNPNSTTAAVTVVVTSSALPFYQVYPVTFRQLRITATAAETTFGNWQINKQILV